MIAEYFGLSYDGPPFLLFSAQHLLALATVVAVAVSIALLTPRLTPGGRELLRWALFGFCIVNWLGWEVWQRANGIWSVQYSLPLHLCTLAVPLSALLLWSRNYTLYQLLYFWSFAGSTQAMLTPDLQANGFNFPHFVYWIFWTSHGVLWWVVIFAGAAWGFRPTWRSLLVAILLTNLVLIPVGLVNWLTGANYMFVARKPDYPTLLDLLGPWPWYIIPLQLIGILAFVLVYLPYAITDLLNIRKSVVSRETAK